MSGPTPERVTELASGDVECLVRGARLLSSGGSVHGTVVVSWLERTLAATGAVELTDVRELPADDLVVAVAFLGSSTILQERPPSGAELVRAVRGVEDRVGARVRALTALRAASVNALTPVVAAAQLGLPLVDADGVGRTFPRIELTVWGAAGVPATPVVLVNAHGDTVTIECRDQRRIEVLARPAITALGGWCAAALYPMKAATLARHGVHGSLGRALRLGRLLAEAGDRGAPRGAELAERLGARLLFTGSVVEVMRPSAAGDQRGVVVMADRCDPDRLLRIETQNECLLALVDGAVVAAVPDLICPVEPGSCGAVGVEQISLGQVLDVFAFAADAAWHTPEGLTLAGPAAFGYPLPYALSGAQR